MTVGEIVGYARTSTAEQEAGLQAQIEELQANGVGKLFSEKVSSVDANRPALKEALSYLREGDTFIVTKPDRLARSTPDLLRIVDGLAKRGVWVRLLSMDVNTATATGRLILTMLAGIAEFERSLMLERQRHGVARAKAEGKYKGRAPTAQRQAEDVRCLKEAGHKPAEIVKKLNISRASVYRILGSPATT